MGLVASLPKGQDQGQHAMPQKDEQRQSRSSSGTVVSVSPSLWHGSFDSRPALFDGDRPTVLPDAGKSQFSYSQEALLSEQAVHGGNLFVASMLPLATPLQDAWQNHAIPLLLTQFSAPFGGSRFFGLLDFLPDLYRYAGEDSCLTLATDAFAQAYLSNQTISPPNFKDRAHVYGKALRSTNQALEDPFEATKDTTVIAIFLLGVREVSSSFNCCNRFRHNTDSHMQVLVGAPKSQSFPGPEAWHVHSQGLTTLLRLRGRDQFVTRRGRNIFWLIYNAIVRSRTLPSSFAVAFARF